MTQSITSTAQKVRAKLRHPVIDSDGHVLEFTPLIMDYVRDIGGGEMVKRMNAARPVVEAGLSEQARRERWVGMMPWWFASGNTLDRATVSLPRLLYERLDELGMDFSVLYPTFVLGWSRFLGDDELRGVLCRAANAYHADLYREFSDRMTPAAIIPMQTPEEAVAELEHSVKDLGLKAVVISSYAHRPLPYVDHALAPADGYSDRLDAFGIDSDYDYDPVWAKCIELGVAPTSHGGHQRFGSRRTSNYMYNQIGHFAAASEALCKSLFMSGVTRRFPDLKFGFLECGMGWACTLYADLVSRWQKRGGMAVHGLNPEKLDRDRLRSLLSEYGDDKVRERQEALLQFMVRGGAPAELDDWAACGIGRAEDIRDLFVPNFYFGCEGDDPINAWAFNTSVNPFGAKLSAIFGSDIGHWDVQDLREPVTEAHELVEKGLITETDLRDFVFANAVEFWAGTNPDFFKGTRVEAEAGKHLAGAA